MIRYYLDGVSQIAAATCAHPALARLRGRGPWVITETGSGVCLQRGHADAWGPVLPGLDGLRYQLADPMPDLASSVKFDHRGDTATVSIGAHRVPVRLAAYAPVSFGLDGLPEGPCEEYGRTAAALFDRLASGEILIGDKQLVAFARLALMSRSDLTAELCHAYGLVNTDSVPAIFEAATGAGKAPAGGGS